MAGEMEVRRFGGEAATISKERFQALLGEVASLSGSRYREPSKLVVTRFQVRQDNTARMPHPGRGHPRKPPKRAIP
jgi:hypothetical protein